MYKSWVLALVLGASIFSMPEAVQQVDFRVDGYRGSSGQIAASGEKVGISEVCSEVIRTQENRCRSACSSSGGYAFDPGVCGIRSKCTCGASTENPPDLDLP